MINVDFLVDDKGFILGFQINGHSGFAENGSDIVCAAVSSAAFMTANTITDVLKINAETFVDNLGKMFFKIKNEISISCKDILLGFKLHMISLEEMYPENITVNYMEV